MKCNTNPSKSTGIKSLWDAGLSSKAAATAYSFLKANGSDSLQSELDILFGEDNAGAWISQGGTAFILKVRFSSVRISLEDLKHV
ncbi:hypothetical protein VpasPP24_16 [Vibrio phage Vpas_PP24]|nr:hypothetical protein VpasPP24_16 [Vibrio phage Vpas_PP24]